jgi:hypothetical protein
MAEDDLSLKIKKTNKKRCAFCQYSGTHRALEVHHIDGDHSNNETGNLLVLCTNCHREAHEKQCNNKNLTLAEIPPEKKYCGEEVAKVQVTILGGYSYYAPIPASLARVMKLTKGTPLRVYRDGDRIIFEEENPVWPVVKPK